MRPLEDDPGMRASILEIWARGQERALQRADVILRAVAALRAGTLDDAQRDEARGEAHRLAGALGSFGMPEGSEHARALELALTDAPDPAHADDLGERAAALRQVVVDGPTDL